MYINMYMYMCMYIPLICIHLYPTGTTVIHMDMGPPLEHNQPTSGHNPIPKWMFLPMPPSITNSSLARGMASWAPPWFMLKFWQTWFCAGQMQAVTAAVRSWVQQPLHAPKTNISGQSFHASGSYILSSPSSASSTHRLGFVPGTVSLVKSPWLGRS